MEKGKKWFSSLNNILMASCLAVMAILVFGNVILRYAFSSGITWSEEVSRFLFVWMTFLGAIAALKENKHLNVDMFVNKLPKNIKVVVLILGQLIMLVVLWLLLEGTWKMTLMSVSSVAPATGLPLSYVYGVGIVASIGMGALVLINIFRILFPKKSLNEKTAEKRDPEDMSYHVNAAGGEK
ncbi:TRAP transporter small permease [Ammoniphilus sp. 3BR4]|uniref:TRAP transporter small permease n=1 Tax=Ammoniphilus sp. 3BR4 TaxID=3158265 RepID=UPI003466FAC8